MSTVGRRAVLGGLVSAATAPFLLTGQAQSAVAVSVPDVLPSRRSILARLRRVNDHWIGANSDPGDNKWARATYFSGNMALYRACNDSRYLKYATDWAETWDYGLNTGVSTRNADNQCAGQVYYDLFDIVPDPAKLTAINDSLNRMVYGSQPTKNDDWTWVDALHMAMPVFARAGVYLQDDAYLTKLWSLYYYPKHTLGLYSYQHELWYRDAKFTPPSGRLSPNGLPVFWSRGNGWAFAAQAKTLGLLPDSAKTRWPEYVRNIGGLARSVTATQRPDGLWGADLGDPQDYPGPETSGTAFFTFGLAYGIRTGLLDRATYLPVAARAWNGLVAKAVHRDGLLGYVQGVGSEPASSQPVTSISTADFGVGAFLLAGSELLKIAR